MNSLRIGDWSPDLSDLHPLSGRLRLQGAGVHPDTLNAEARLQLRMPGWDQWRLDTLNVHAGLTPASGRIRVWGDGPSGRLDADVSLGRPFTGAPFDAALRLKHVNPGFVLQDSLQSDITGELRASGQLGNLQHLILDASVFIDSSIIYNTPVDTILADLKLRDGTITVPRLSVRSPALALEAEAAGTPDSLSQAEFTLRPREIRQLPFAFADTSTHINGRIRGNLSGPWQALALNADLQLNAELYNTSIDSLGGRVSGRLGPQPDADFDLGIRKAGVSGMTVSDVRFSGQLRHDSLASQLQLSYQDTNRLQLQSTFVMDSLYHLNVSQLVFVNRGRTWSNPAPLSASWNTQRAAVDSLLLTSDGQKIRLHGI
ncbi:MAG: hypothetical protein U5R06_15080 [candidate division KSB1 bacterium]|nr:hypothetical protein [candidate division KSB1 bacterium]